MKCQGGDFIIYSLFVDDMMRISSSDALKEEFMEKYTKDLDITEGGLMETYWVCRRYAGQAIARQDKLHSGDPG